MRILFYSIILLFACTQVLISQNQNSNASTKELQSPTEVLKVPKTTQVKPSRKQLKEARGQLLKKKVATEVNRKRVQAMIDRARIIVQSAEVKIDYARKEIAQLEDAVDINPEAIARKKIALGDAEKELKSFNALIESTEKRLAEIKIPELNAN